MNKKSKFPTEVQIEIWNLYRERQSGRKIAKEKKVTPAFVSKTLKEANKRIKELIKDTALSNKIKLDFIDAELGFARGYSKMLNVKSFIVFSPSNGIQVWHEHKGDCVNCELFELCRTQLLNEFKDRKIKIESETLAPTDLGEKLFEELERIANDKV